MMIGDQDSQAITMFPHQSPPNPTTTSVKSNTKRRRGRPAGSKNKQKPPPSVTVTKKREALMSPHVLEVSNGSDIVATVTQFCNHWKTGLCVLSGRGAVSNVTFRLPANDFILQGRFSLLSISATILPPSFTNSDFVGKFVISLTGSRGQTVGGSVVGPLIASGTVYIVAVSFNNPVYHRLPLGGMRNSGDVSVSGAADQDPGSGGVDRAQHHVAPLATAETLLSLYGPASDIWAPTPH